MKGQSTKSRVLSLERQITRLQSRLNKIRRECQHKMEKDYYIGPSKCAECGYSPSEHGFFMGVL